MYICDKCDEVFTETDCDLAHDRCPTCGSRSFDEAVRCAACGEWIPLSEAYGYSHRLCCKTCIDAQKEDIDFLVGATDDVEEIEIPVLYRYIFSDDDIQAILYRAAKELKERGDFDASDYIKDYANDIAEALVKEEDK